jgi:hypothetical protein
VGERVAGVELLFEVAGEKQKATTGSDGRVRVDGGRSQSASARFASVRELRAKLDERWDKERTKPWQDPPYGAVVFEVCWSKELHAISLEAEVTKTVVLDPPYRIRLLDDEGQAMAGLACSVAVGGAVHEVTSDGEGWIEFPVGNMCPETATVEWEQQRGAAKLKRSMVVALACHDHDGDRRAIAVARLRNHGYQVEDLAHAIAAFQLDHDLAYEPLDGGEISEATVAKIFELWEDRHA